MSDSAARRQSVARKGLEMARRAQVEAGLADFLGLRTLAADLRGVVGRIVIANPSATPKTIRVSVTDDSTPRSSARWPYSADRQGSEGAGGSPLAAL